MGRWLWIVRTAVTLGTFAVLFAVVPVAELWRALSQVSIGVWIGVLAVFLVCHGVAALKWRLLIVGAGALPARVWLPAHMAGLTANLCLPGIVGGDVVRAAWVVGHGRGIEPVAVASIADRAVDCVALLMLAGMGLAWVGQFGGLAARIVLGSAGVVLLAAAVFAVGYRILRRRAVGGAGSRAVQAVQLLVARPRLPVAALVLSLLVQGTFVLLNARLGDVTGMQVAPAAWLAVWPLSKLVAFVPISLGGLGVREAALVALMQPFGAPARAVLAAGLLWESVLVATGLIGWGITATLTPVRR
jgi:uncharacterized membrane protein YbhN (UPF0104 family)